MRKPKVNYNIELEKENVAFAKLSNEKARSNFSYIAKNALFEELDTDREIMRARENYWKAQGFFKE